MFSKDAIRTRTVVVAQFLSCASLLAHLVLLSCFYMGIVLLVTTLVRAVRPYLPMQTLRLGQVVFPVDAGFILGVIILFVCYEVSTRLLIANARSRVAKRVLGFLVFAAFFRYGFVAPLALPRANEFLPRSVVTSRCAFFSNFSAAELSPLPALCEAFIGYFERLYGVLPADSQYQVVVFDNTLDFRKALAGYSINSNVLGLYIPSSDSVFLTREAGLGTLTHELTHAIFERISLRGPPWVAEGIPSFFEKFFLLEEQDKLRFQFGFVNPSRWMNVRPDLLQSELSAIAAATPHSGRPAQMDPFVAYFMWQQGVFDTFLRRLTIEWSESPTYLEELLAVDRQTLDTRWRDFILRLEAREQGIVSTPASAMFSSKQDWQEKINRHSILTLEVGERSRSPSHKLAPQAE